MKFQYLLIGTSLSLIPSLTSAQCVATQDCATLGYTPAPAALASNAPLATPGHASNQSRNFAMNTASPKPAPAPDIPAASAKPAMVNTPNVPVRLATFGTIRLNNVKTPPPTALSARCIMPMGHVQMTIFPVRNCLVL